MPLIPLPPGRRRLATAFISLFALGAASGPAGAASAAKAAAPAEFAPPAPYIPPTLFSLPDDLEVTLWARTPQLRNPSNIDVDAQGRVWVAESYNYRRHAGKDPAGDRIMVLADADGDGTADQSHVFVQEPGLLAPMGVAVIDNRIVVSCTPDLIVYTDVDRNGRFDPAIDRREVLLTGFDGRNHDHSLHSVTMGPDGKWYFNHGNTGAWFTDRSGRTFRIGSPYEGDRKLTGPPPTGRFPRDFAGERSDDGHVYIGGTAYRMNPDGTQVEPIGFNFRNSYEQTVTSFGDVFHNDNDDPPASRTTFLQEYGNLGFASRDGRRTWAADRRPGQSTAVAEWRQQDPGTVPAGDVYGNGAPTGIVFYEGDALGAKWRGVLLSCETSRNTVLGYFPQASGAGYTLERFSFLTTNPGTNFAGIDSQRGRLRGDDLKTWFRPSDVAIGPDGAIYVADWFDPRTGGHAALDASFAGAIYRIAPKGKKLPTPRIDLGTTAGQIAALRNPAGHVRALGFLKLRASGAAVVAPVTALLNDPNPYVRGRAVFLLAQLGPTGVAGTVAQLRHADPMLRIAAFRALRRIAHDVLDHARTLADDPSPAVRREVALALRDVPFAAARDLLLRLARSYDGRDRAYLEAWGTGCTGKEREIYALLAAEPPDRDPRQWPTRYAHLIWRLTPAGAEKDFALRAAAAALPEQERLAAVTALGFMPTTAAAHALLDLAEQATGQVKAHALWWLMNYQESRWPAAGIPAALKSRGLYDPDTITVTAVTVPEPAPTRLPPAAEVAKLAGDPVRGATLAQACRLCHRIGDQGIDYGPALNGFARGQATEVVINAILDPSAEIAHGYEGVALTLRAGGELHGIALSGGDPLVIQSTGGLTQLVPAAMVRGSLRKPLGRSLMLSAEQLGLGAQEVADIVAYLKTL